MDKKHRHYSILAAGFLVNMALGAGYAYGIFRPALEKHWGLSPFDSGLPYMIFLTVFALAMPAGGAVIERLGEKKALLLGASLLGTGWVLAGFSRNILALSLLYGVIGGVGVGIAYGAPLSLAVKFFPGHRGLAMGIMLSGFGLSPLLTAPLVRACIEAVGPVAAFAVTGAVLAAAIVLLANTIRFVHVPAREDAPLPGRAHDLNTRGMLKTPVFYALWLVFAAACAIGLSAVGVTASFALEVTGLGMEKVTLLVMLFSVFNSLGRPVFGWLADRICPGTAGALSFLLISAGALALQQRPSSEAAYILAFSLFWLNLGAWLAIAPVATAFFFGPLHQPRNYGVMYTAYGAGALAGITLSAKLKESLGSYQAELGPLAAAALLLAAASFFLLGGAVKRTKRLRFGAAARTAG